MPSKCGSFILKKKIQLEHEETKLCQPAFLKKDTQASMRGMSAILPIVADSACAGMCCINNMLTGYTILSVCRLRNCS